MHLIQSDLTKLPFSEELFDDIFSIGVLHQTPDTEVSFKSLIPYLKPGGRIAIWVYPPEMKVHEDKLRTFTTRLPLRVLFGFCVLRAIKNKMINGLRLLLGRRSSTDRFWPQVMSHFDSLAPNYAFSHSPEEVMTWFEEGHLVDVRCQARRTAVSGSKPGFPRNG